MGPPKSSPGVGFTRSGVGYLGTLHPPALTLAEPSLESMDTVRQLLSIAAGDFSSITTAENPSTALGTIGANITSHSSSANLSRSANGPGGETRSTVAMTATGFAGPRSTASSASPPLPATRILCGTGKPQVMQVGAVGGDASAITNAEARVFYMTMLVAQALRLEDYWVHLGHQIEVDQHVEFIQYCAREGFSAPKTVHLLGWWRQYRLLVRGGADAPEGSTFPALRLSDGNPQKSAPPHHSHGGGAGEHGSAGSGAGSQGKEGGTKASRRVRALSVSFVGGAPLNVDSDGFDSASASLAVPTQPLTHAEALSRELQRFVQWELEHEWAWRQVPREPIVNSATVLISPRAASSSNVMRRAPSNATAAGAGKPSRAEKAKLQQLQQQEMEAEEQRLARVASMPAENIFLTKEQIDGFLQFVVKDDLLSHTTLHIYVASHSQQLMSTPSRSERKPACFMVQVDTPMCVLPLREATRLSAFRHGMGSTDASASPALRDGATTGDTAAGGAAAPQQAPRKGSASGSGKSANRRQRSRSKLNFKEAAALAAAEAAAAAAALSNNPAGSEAALPLTAMEALRAEQAKEAAAYRVAYDEELAQAAAHQKAVQHAADIELFFENSTSNDAVKAVYASIEDEVSARQQRILQRIVALERVLGLAPSSSHGSRVGSAIAAQEGSQVAVADPKLASLGSASNISTSSTKKNK
ncbi:hypothetical protein JKF63_07089 [Porcisia hertigi]|uniref:Uncharacterized protein n=1 Tax=Porcisia hertigi TaxID=2761500 RepID=A0A836LKH9_9TRYP|nr:hypothetical protein JKF63_07089 [Porcisia hertigi]